MKTTINLYRAEELEFLLCELTDTEAANSKCPQRTYTTYPILDRW